MKPDAKELTDEEALAKAKDLVKQLEGGADFATVANKESDDTGSNKNGGDLPTFRHGQMVPQFETAAFALEPGKISQPVKSQFGYHIIKVETKSYKKYEDVKAEIDKKIRPEQSQKAIEDLQKKANVVMDPTYFGTAKQ